METLGTQFFDRLAACLDAFIAAWESKGSPPRLAAFVPTQDEALHRHALLELVKVDIEYRWAAGEGKLLDAYVAEHPELDGPDGPPPDLIYEEFRHRQKAGDDVQAEAVLARYPARAAELGHLLELDTQAGGTSLAGQMPRNVPDPGEEIDDFLLIDRLGRGAFATVFLARQRSMQRLVALKVSANRGEEAQTLAQLDHPNIVRVFDQRVLPEQDLRLLYMEYVPAGGLDSVIDQVMETPVGERRGQLLLDTVAHALLARGETPPTDSRLHARLAGASWPEAVCIVGAQLAGALAYAHARGVLHRDVKPANVLLSRTGAAKLADFNISYSDQLEGGSAAAYLGGSLAYMSAEQLEACCPLHDRPPEALDGRADLFSLGILLFELLTGARPFVEEDELRGGWSASIQDMIDRRRAGPGAERLALIPADAPRLLRSALLRCLDPDPAQRFQDASEAASAFELALRPRAAALLAPPPESRVHPVRRHAMAAILVGSLVPNVILSVLNVLYNLNAVIAKPEQTGFMDMVMVVNAVAYALGLWIALAWIRPLARAARRLEAGARPDGPEREDLGQRWLRLPRRLMLLIFPLWALGGLAFPVWLYQRGAAKLDAWFSFTASNMLFGVLAATACYFIAMRMVLWALLPPLLRPGAGTPDERHRLRRVSKRSAVWFGVMTAVPFLSLILLALVPGSDRSPFLVLGLIGSVGFALAYGAMLAIRRDVNALDEAISI